MKNSEMAEESDESVCFCTPTVVSSIAMRGEMVCCFFSSSAVSNRSVTASAFAEVKSFISRARVSVLISASESSRQVKRMSAHFAIDVGATEHRYESED